MNIDVVFGHVEAAKQSVFTVGVEKGISERDAENYNRELRASVEVALILKFHLMVKS